MPRRASRAVKTAPRHHRRNPQAGAHQRMTGLENKLRARTDLAPREAHELRLLYDALQVAPLNRLDTRSGRDKRMLEWEVGRSRGMNPYKKWWRENPATRVGGTGFLEGRLVMFTGLDETSGALSGKAVTVVGGHPVTVLRQGTERGTKNRVLVVTDWMGDRVYGWTDRHYVQDDNPFREHWDMSPSKRSNPAIPGEYEAGDKVLYRGKVYIVGYAQRSGHTGSGERGPVTRLKLQDPEDPHYYQDSGKLTVDPSEVELAEAAEWRRGNPSANPGGKVASVFSRREYAEHAQRHLAEHGIHSEIEWWKSHRGGPDDKVYGVTVSPKDYAKAQPLAADVRAGYAGVGPGVRENPASPGQDDAAWHAGAEFGTRLNEIRESGTNEQGHLRGLFWEEAGKWPVDAFQSFRAGFNTTYRHENPAASPEQYRLAQAVLSGTARETGMDPATAREIVERTPAGLRSEYSRYTTNPDYRQEFSAFGAGKQFRLSGAYSETGVANARVVRYGFVKWWNELPPLARGPRGTRKRTEARLEKEFREGWAAGKQVEKREGNPIGNPRMGPNWLEGASSGAEYARSIGHQQVDDATLEAAANEEIRTRKIRDKEYGIKPRIWPRYKLGFKAGYQNELTYKLWRDAGGGRVGNPAGEAAALYEEFHGVPSAEEVVVTEEVRYHGNLAGLGELVEIVIKTPSGYKAVLDFGKSGTLLCSSEDGKQLYLRGGDQSIDLDAIHMAGEEWLRDSMVLGTILKLTYRTAKKFDDLRVLDYEHKLGEVSGVRPELVYDVLNNQLSVAGGQYDVRPEGVVN